jgi:hypothetical protein
MVLIDLALPGASPVRFTRRGLQFDVMTTGAISTSVVKEDWQTGGGTLKLDQTGNWVNYTRVREGNTEDDWANNLHSKINQYTKIDRVSGGGVAPTGSSNRATDRRETRPVTRNEPSAARNARIRSARRSVLP